MIVTPEEFDFEWLSQIPIQKRKRGNQSSKSKTKYLDIITAFDIETTRIDEIEQAVMYIWMWQFDETYTVIGRTWNEFLEFKSNVLSVIGEATIVTFVHNLSYEFQFLRGIHHFSMEDVFAVKPRKLLKATMGQIELRCSYLHTNMSLAEYTRKMNVEHQKLSGAEFDYNTKRYWFTELTERELEYCVNDVLGLVEAIKTEMEFDSDNLYTFPLTSTGYVRRNVKRAMKQVSHYYIQRIVPDVHTYEMLREAFRGGDTHANRRYANKVLTNVKSADRSSSYPDVLCNDEFPIGRFFNAGELSLDDVIDLMLRRKKAVVMRVRIWNLEIVEDFGDPYISRDKSRNIKNAVYDNGRILSADYLETTITDIDLKIIMKEYNYECIEPYDVSYARYGKLPQPIIDQNIKYYKGKTELKNVEGMEIYYMKSKNLLNAIYGLMAQDPVKQSIDFEDEFVVRSEPVEELLEKANKKAFVVYQWGVWTTAHARYRLHDGIWLAGDGYVYSDTDSVKYIGDVDWTEYNQKRIEASKKSGAYATDPKGETHYMGVFEQEHDYAYFKTMGAKKYAYKLTEEGPTEVTISGVMKYDKGSPTEPGYRMGGGTELDQYDGINSFKEGFIFVDAGGTESVYNDHPAITEWTVEGHTIPITSNVYIKDSTYTLGISADYMRILENYKNND